MKFTVRAMPQNRRVMRLVTELDDRIAGIVREFPGRIADAMLLEVMAKAPKGKVARYPSMLETRRFKVPGVDAASGVVGMIRATKLKPKEAKDTVLYVHPRKIDGAADPAAMILAEHNPWTMETLPYEPSKRAANIVARKVRPSQATRVAAERRAEAKGVQQRLLEAGVKAARKHPALIERTVTPDVAMQVLRMEFGLDGPDQSHWRPALRAVRRTHTKRILKSLGRWLWVPSELRWRKKVTTRMGRGDTLRRIRPFQAKIATAR